MSSNLTTYFVVAYDHVDEEFFVDSGMAEARFQHDTWDDDLGEWVYLDESDEVSGSLTELTTNLNEIIKKGK